MVYALKMSALVGVGLLISLGVSASTLFSYDVTGRVTTAAYDNGLCVAYSYDSAGNRTAQSNVATTTPAWGSSIWGCFNWTP